LLTLAISLLLGGAASTSAAGDTGAGVGANPIVLSDAARAGTEYQLPSLYVLNTGTVASHYRVVVEQLAPRHGRAVPPSWISFDRNGFMLTPNESTSVKLTLNVPADAPSGRYSSDLVAGTEAGPGTRGAVASAQAATKLMFTVGIGGGGGFPWPWPWPWWVYLSIACGLALIVLIIPLQRHYGLRLRVERRH
jgi:hypothetical protein